MVMKKSSNWKVLCFIPHSWNSYLRFEQLFLKLQNDCLECWNRNWFLKAFLSLIVNIVSLTFIIDKAYITIRSLYKPIQESMVDEEDVRERQRKQNLINEIFDTDPLNGMGLFSIKRSTLTGMVSIGVTYVIILVQFQMSAS